MHRAAAGGLGRSARASKILRPGGCYSRYLGKVLLILGLNERIARTEHSLWKSCHWVSYQGVVRRLSHDPVSVWCIVDVRCAVFCGTADVGPNRLVEGKKAWRRVVRVNISVYPACKQLVARCLRRCYSHTRRALRLLADTVEWRRKKETPSKKQNQAHPITQDRVT